MPQLEGPTTKNIQLCTRGLWGEKGKIKSFKKKKRCFGNKGEQTKQKIFFPNRVYILANKVRQTINIIIKYTQ